MKGFYKTNVQQYIKKVVVLIGSEHCKHQLKKLKLDDYDLKKERLLREQGNNTVPWDSSSSLQGLDPQRELRQLNKRGRFGAKV